VLFRSNVAEPISPALEQVKRILFQPFDLGKWFIIGFCAWLAVLGESGAGFHGSGGGNHGGNISDFRHALDEARNYLLNNLDWIIPLVALAMILILGLGLLILWLNSRGKFMFLHCVALNRAEVAEPWNKFSAEGNSLFWFRLVLGCLGMILTLPLVGIIIFMIVRMAYRGEPDAGGILTTVGLAVGLCLVAVVMAVVKKLTKDFVVPVMFLRRTGCWAAWREFYRMFCAHFWMFVLYLLFQIVLTVAIGALVLIAVFVTCCISCCLLILPYLGTVLLLPVLVFKRAYSLYFFAQFGPEYDVFPPPVPAPVSPSPGLPPMPVPPPVM
jgi:hypothetical protein